MKERAPINPPPNEPLNRRGGRAASFIRQKKGDREARIGVVPPPKGSSDPTLEAKKKELAFKALTQLPKEVIEERTPDELESPEEKLLRFAREDAGAVDHQAYKERVQRLRDRREGFLAIIENPSLSTTVKQQARVEAAKLKRQIEALLPKSEVQETRARSQGDLLKKLEEKRLELLRREADPTIFYPLRYEAANELRTVEKKIGAIKRLQASVKASYAPPGEVIPTAKSVRRQILDIDQLGPKTSAADREAKHRPEERTSKVQDLYGYYMEAIRLALDPRALQSEKQRAKSDLVYHAIKTQRAVELLPTATERQRERKARLEKEIEPFVLGIDEQFDWTNPRLLTVYKAITECYKTQGILSQERTPERIQDFKKTVLELETRLLSLKRSLVGNNVGEDESILPTLTAEDLILREALIKNSESATPPATSHEFKTVPTDISIPFNKITPLPFESYDAETSVARYKDLLALPDEDSVEARAHAQRVRRAERHLTSLENILALFKAQATRESDNLLYLRQPKAIGAGADYTLDDIDRFRRLKENIPGPTMPSERVAESVHLKSMKLKSELELRQEGVAFQRSKLETEIQTLEDKLRMRHGGKLPGEKPAKMMPFETLRDFGARLWNGTKDLLNKAFTKGYVSNGEIEAQYQQKQLELKKLDAASQDLGREVRISRRIKQERERAKNYLQTLSDRDSSHEQKIEAIRGYHALQTFLNTCKPTSIIDEQLLTVIAQDLKRIRQGVAEYEQKLKRLNIELIKEIRRQENLPLATTDPERLKLLLVAQETNLTREWSVHMEATDSLSSQIINPNKEQLKHLEEAHRLEYELANNSLLRQATKQREKQEKRIKECYQIAYGEPSSRWAFWRRAA
jgi:hypothetical protein